MFNFDLNREVQSLMATEETKEVATRVIGILCQTDRPSKEDYFLYITAIVKVAMESKELTKH